MILLMCISFADCSYVLDFYSGDNASSFSGTATYDGSKVTIAWDTTGESYDIYRTEVRNDEFSDYVHVGFFNTATCYSSPYIDTLTNPAIFGNKKGIFFYRIVVNVRNDKNEVVSDKVSVAIPVEIY
jgi:hypothetical protein